jgi:cellulose synthase/poly-beta-1,6-N-acetylglucosamine synthase-like glycosyltransferase
MIAVLFWAAVGLIAYTYVGFPLLVLARGRLLPRRYRTSPVTPSVSMVIAAHNEASVIGAKVENLLALDYPDDLLEIVIASDGSDDGTDEKVRQYEGRSGRAVRLLSLPRAGKAATLTAAVAQTAGDVLVFSDANSMFARDAVTMLVRPFADPDVGGVAGDQRYLGGGAADGVASGEQSYWSFDRLIKDAESRAGSVISATGAIYAIRRALFAPVRPDVTDDFYTSTGVIAQGQRLVFESRAVAYEPVAQSGGDEFGRKVRVMTRGLRGVIARRALLNPFRYGFYSVQLVSHKVLRRLMVLPLALLLVTSALRWGDGPAFQVLTVAQVALYVLGAVGLLAGGSRVGRIKLLAVPAFFCLVNVASVCAVWNIVRGNRIDRWQPRRVESVDEKAGAHGAGASSSETPTDDLAWRPKT